MIRTSTAASEETRAPWSSTHLSQPEVLELDAGDLGQESLGHPGAVPVSLLAPTHQVLLLRGLKAQCHDRGATEDGMQSRSSPEVTHTTDSSPSPSTAQPPDSGPPFRLPLSSEAPLLDPAPTRHRPWTVDSLTLLAACAVIFLAQASVSFFAPPSLAICHAQSAVGRRPHPPAPPSERDPAPHTRTPQSSPPGREGKGSSPPQARLHTDTMALTHGIPPHQTTFRLLLHTQDQRFGL